jgi:C1A family cysteine protease
MKNMWFARVSNLVLCLVLVLLVVDGLDTQGAKADDRALGKDNAGGMTPASQTRLMTLPDFNLHDDPATCLASKGGEPDMIVSATTFDVSLPSRTTPGCSPAISNGGDAELPYVIDTQETAGVGSGLPPTRTSPLPLSAENNSDTDNVCPIEEPDIRPAAQEEFAPRQTFEEEDTLEDLRDKIEQNGYNFTVDHNWVYDMSAEEKEHLFGRHDSGLLDGAGSSEDMGPIAKQLGKTTLPSQFDWRDYSGHSYVGDIRDQGMCGSCYAFGACAAAEGTYNLAMGLYDENCSDFSESFIMWCLGSLPAYNTHFYGCEGADYDYAELTALTVEGICGEGDFPYQTSPGCGDHWGDPRVAFDSWYRIPCGDIDAIKTAIMTYGVVDAAVLTTSAFEAYSGGIYQDSNTGCTGDPCYHTTADHAVALVGWDDNGDAESNGYWILRNSWGTGWGESGYMRIKYRSAAVACEVCYLVYSPALNTPPVLSDGAVSPASGYVTTDFTYSVTYTDADNDVPTFITVTIDGGASQDMTEVNPGDTDHTDGKDYEYTASGLAQGAHIYQFAASDGTDDAFGDTGSHDGPTVGTMDEPDITIFPPSFDVTLPSDATHNYTLAIDNDGAATLTYGISDRQTIGESSQADKAEMFIRLARNVLETHPESSLVESRDATQVQGTWQNIMAEDFEGVFPGVWDVFCGEGSIDAYWGKDNYNPHSGSYSAFCAKAGSAGVDPPSSYPNNVEVFMICGPFSLTDASDAELNFYWWYDTELEYDDVSCIALVDESNYVYCWGTGDSQGWESQSLDLGSLCGQLEVWLAFVFTSDATITNKGAFVDDVVLRKYVSAANSPPNTPSSPSPANHATGVSISADLGWSGGDPDAGDVVTYDVYFGASPSPPLVSNDQSGTTYDPGTLAYSTKYYWRITAADNHGASTPGLTWDFTTQVPGNAPPNTPSSPSPANHAPSIPISADLSWVGGDPDGGDTVIYDVYFGTSSTPPLVSNDQSGTTYDPGTLATSTKYYWRISAADNHGASTTGPLWDFTTGGAAEDCPWLDESPESGSVPVGESSNITVTINTTGLTVGNTYTAEIVIANNDPDENPATVPVTLHIGDGGVAVSIVPTTYTAAVNGTFTVDIELSGTDPVRGASAYIDFDSTYLEVQSITAGTALNTVLEDDYDNVAGTIDYSAGKLSGTLPTGTFTLAIIELRALAETSSTPLTFVFEGPGRVTDVITTGSVSVLGAVTDGEITITSAAVIGQVIFQGRPAPPHTSWVNSLTVVVSEQGTGTAIHTCAVTTNSAGGFSFAFGGSVGTYDIGVKGPHTLSRLEEGVEMGSGIANVNFGTLLEGDCDNSDMVNIYDFGILADAFGALPASGNWDQRADLDSSGAVNIYDFGLLADNFGLLGEMV